MKIRAIMVPVMTLATLASCGDATGTKAIDPADFDLSVAPGQDFYEYAVGGWKKNNPLKPEYSRYGSFDILAENNMERIRSMFEEMQKTNAAPGTTERKIADLYNMGMDSVRLNADGLKTVLPFVQSLERVADLESFVIASADLEAMGIGGGLYGCSVESDMTDSDRNIVYLGESGLTLSNRDYYLLPEHEKIREGLKTFLTKIFRLAGYEDAELRAQDAFDIEMAIAVPTWSMVQNRDVQAMYNPMTSAAAAEKFPELCLDMYFSRRGIAPQPKIIVAQLSYFDDLNRMIGTLPVDKLRHFLQAAVLETAAGCTTDEMYEASFDFFSRQISGIEEQKPRWKRAISVPNNALGEAVGEIYVRKYFPEEDKARVMAIVCNIQKALGKHISALQWMSDETKQKALEKLDAYTIKIGYPDKWKDYSTLEVDPEKSYFENIISVNEWYNADNLAELQRPVDRAKWYMTPQTVNAYYNPSTNEICFPAAILQPPFYFRDEADDVNYGAIGVVISHEMTHGFDDQGRLFDKDGNFSSWWTEEDAKAFNCVADRLVDQFDKVEVLPGVFANGRASLGENIADQGGLRVAYTAMVDSWNGSIPDPKDGFTPYQRFYLAYAKVWAQNITEEEMQKRVLTDVHSLGEHRVNVTVRNLDTFFSAFDIKEGDAMWRPESERVIIW